ncbi:acyl-[ACP]--phospholipid O-acyltransferase [Methylocapsa acidiphila]|uniref:acyl-[ACP]--phospholipid O-acyltransferase n=1 Tax=Methylocapsa acidiphila TaxID=133552 RepID=UPI000401D043|nr:acyl-[ACP]--phospholipid O-acyltransferase [Methylocapsa acidiphila]
MPRALLASKRFAPLFWCQFLSAFNDNVLKNALVFLILFEIGGQGAQSLVTLAGGVLIAPFFIFSALGGELADRFDKALVARRLKFVEIGVAAIAAGGFIWHAPTPLFCALFLYGAIGALFGPIKYGILPDHLRPEELPAANALVEGATFLAILSGTIVGGIAMTEGGGGLLALGVLFFAALSWIASLFIPAAPAAAPDLVIERNVVRSTARLLVELWADARLRWGGLVTSLFWLIGAVSMSLLAPLVTLSLNGSELVVTAYLAVFAISIAIGSGLAAFLVDGRINLLPAAIGTAIAGLASLDLGLAIAGLPATESGVKLSLAAFFARPIAWRSAFDLAILAIAGGLMIVPAFAAVQSWAAPDRRARVVAAVGVLNAAFMLAGAIVVALLQTAGAPLYALFIGMGLCAILAAWGIVKTLPTNPLRDLVAMLFRIAYRVEARGLENFAEAGQNPIIALNHQSFLDAALAFSILPRDALFAINTDIATRWWVKPFFRFVRVLALDPTRPLGARDLVHAVKAGESLVIFPEGRITVTGALMKVYDGAGLIADKSGAAIVPVRIDGLESTIFSQLDKAKVRRRWFPKVTITALPPTRLEIDPELKGKARRQAAGAALYQIMSDTIFRTTPIDRTIFAAVADSARRCGAGRIAVEDPVGGALSARKLLIGANVLGRKLKPLAGEGEATGVMLPSANAAAVTFLAASSAGLVPAMINFTAGAGAILAACAAARVETILTARAFIEKARLEKLVAALEPKVRIVYLEDVRAAVSGIDMARAFISWRRPLACRRADDAAVILFTSGTEGAPKGVALSHRNILANVAQAAARVDFNGADKVFNVLPVFHSFGLTVGLVLPLVSGVRLYLYPTPLHYRIIPELVYETNATILFGTNTFLAGYARSANPYDFRSLRYVLAGAEPVAEATRRIWMDKFGQRILEGYGVTETAPALAFNTPMFNRPGTVGRLMPGVEARLEPAPGIVEGGRLFVRGPNVMLGYLKADQPGVLQPPPDGWHDTGDIVVIDADGFVTIKGRTKRFAKVGGEMVSLAAIEALAAELWPDAQSAAIAEPDPRKGETVILLTRFAKATRAEFQAYAKAKGASELMFPAEVMIAADLPLLGSGKVDLVQAGALVKRRRTASEAA